MAKVSGNERLIVTSPTATDAPLGGARRRRHRSRLPLIAAVAAIVAVGGTTGWLAAKYFTGRISQLQSVEVQLPPADVDQGGVKQRPDQSIVTKLPPTAPLKTVASYPPDLSYVLSQWSAGMNLAGHIDRAKLGDRVLAANGAIGSVDRDKVIALSGWAGDESVGVRYPYVLISACGKVVAHAAVNLARPDVAKAVHANLGQSGWRAQIALRHLPDCKNLKLSAWGVPPGDSRWIFPLNGQLALSIAPAGKVTEKSLVTSAAPPLRPADMKPLAPVQLTVKANILNLRRCAGADCAIVGKLAKGEWTVMTLGDSNGWLLIATPDRAGWVSKRYVGVSQPPG